MRIVMMGTGPFAVPSFKSLLDSDHSVVALITRPPRPARGRRKEPVNPMREVAKTHHVPVTMPESVNAAESVRELTSLMPELFVVCDFGQILSSEALGVAKYGGINLHASLLPKYRGAAPINWAIYHGETETGVTVIHMTPKLDAGPCIVQLKTPIDPNESAVEVEDRLAILGVDAVRQGIGLLADSNGDELVGLEQDPQLATRAPRLKKNDGLVDWNRSAQQICDQVRAFKPWPKTYTHWIRPGSDPFRLILEEVRVAAAASDSAEPGTVVHSSADQLLVATGGGMLSLCQVQPSGKRAMSVAEFLNGHSVAAGDRLA